MTTTVTTNKPINLKQLSIAAGNIPLQMVKRGDGSVEISSETLSETELADKVENHTPDVEPDPERELTAVRISAQLFAKSMISADTADESTVLVLGPLFPELDLGGASVKTDEVYRHNDEVVVVLQDHTTESHWEDLSASLYRVYKASSGDGTYPVWEQPESTDPYGLEWDDGSSPVVVQNNGRLYENAHAENVWEPGAQGTESLWIDLGEA